MISVQLQLATFLFMCRLKRDLTSSYHKDPMMFSEYSAPNNDNLTIRQAVNVPVYFVLGYNCTVFCQLPLKKLHLHQDSAQENEFI